MQSRGVNNAVVGLAAKVHKTPSNNHMKLASAVLQAASVCGASHGGMLGAVNPWVP